MLMLIIYFSARLWRQTLPFVHENVHRNVNVDTFGLEDFDSSRSAGIYTVSPENCAKYFFVIWGAGMAEWLANWVSVSDLNAEGPGSNPGGGKEI